MILIFGKTGYVSKRFQDFFEYRKIPYNVVSLRETPSLKEIQSIIETINPAFVINCIGYTGVPNIEACEDQKEECLYVNVILAETIAQACKNLHKPLGFVSTGCIYNQDETTGWRYFNETDAPNFSFNQRNCSWYSGTKALGESLVSKTWDQTYIWRIRMPFNHIPHDKNIISKFLKYPKVLNIPNSFTNLDEFVMYAFESMFQGIPYGIYNMTNLGITDAKSIISIAQTYNLGKSSYEYINSVKEFNSISSSPRSNCMLNTRKIGQYFSFYNVNNSFEKCLQNWGLTEKNPFWGENTG